MRLLTYESTGEINVTRDFAENDIPKYAILSHTWGADSEEVSFLDLMNGTGRSKPGYDKIRFCGERAKRDDLHFFWVDTCCIDKSNNSELTEAINSMFRWFQNSTKRYVYLADVSRPTLEGTSQPEELLWKTAFRKCRWFSRGWTLQELIAPALVEFFSKEGRLLGDKKSLEHLISEITGIPIQALDGSQLPNININERLSWQQSRNTTRSEDKAYSLLGICGAYMPLIYGEGQENAFKRLYEEIQKGSKGISEGDFSISFSLYNVLDIEHFVAREEELEEMHKELNGNGTRRTVILHGLGGMGKTQLAVAYAKRHKDSYSAIFWLNTRDEDCLKHSFSQMAGRILREHPSASRLNRVSKEDDPSELMDAVKDWLGLPGNTRWLLIYDNYDNPKLLGTTQSGTVDIHKFIPDSYQGSVLVTTRSSRVDFGHTMKVNRLENLHDSLKILSNASRRPISIHDLDAVKLAKELDGLPLALATAGSYLHQVAMSFVDYLRLYKSSWLKLQRSSPGLNSYEDRTLYSTWQISFDHVREQNKLSAMLLRLWAYLDSQDLWFELLRHRTAEDPEWIRELTEDELTFHAAMRVLSDHGFVEIDMSSQVQIESRGYSIHGCVHAWTKHVLNQTSDSSLEILALNSVTSHIPEKDTNRWWLTQRRLLQHAARCTDRLWMHSVTNDKTSARWYHRLGNLYADQGKLHEAENLYQQALQEKEEALGPEHLSTLSTVNNLGLLYVVQGRLREAETMYQRSLQGFEKTLGPSHTSILDTVNNLGNIYKDQGKVEEAENLYQRALQGYEGDLGPDHTSTLNTVNNLGNIYKDQGKLEEAERMYQQALKGYENALGPDVVNTSIPALNTVNNLGLLYVGQGKLREAETMYQRALEGKEEALSPEHPSTLDTVNNLGLLYVDQGRLKEAETMYQRALQGYEKALGAERFRVSMPALNTVNNLGSLYKDQGKLDEAESLFQRALQGYEDALGTENFRVSVPALNAVNNLGSLYKHRGKLDEAENMYQRALQGYEKAVGPEHTSTLNTVNNLGNLYKDQEKLDEAEHMYQRALQGYEKALGTEGVRFSIPALNTINNLGSLYEDKGKLEEAERMYQRALKGYEQVLGTDAVKAFIPALNTINNLGDLYKDQGKLYNAEQMYQQALQGYERALGPEHQSTLKTGKKLGLLYTYQNKTTRSRNVILSSITKLREGLMLRRR